METLLQNVEGIAKALTLMVIHLCFPEVRSECRVVSDIPLAGFRSLSTIREYVNNIIDYGVSSEVRGRIFIMGNTGTGKSSLAGTLKFFSDMPDDPPRRFLTGDPENNHLEKTKAELNRNTIFYREFHKVDSIQSIPLGQIPTAHCCVARGLTELIYS